MSSEDSDDSEDSPPAPVRAYRTVTPPYRGHPNEEMHLIGLLYLAGLLVLLLPLAPFILLIWLLDKVRGKRRPRMPV